MAAQENPEEIAAGEIDIAEIIGLTEGSIIGRGIEYEKLIENEETFYHLTFAGENAELNISGSFFANIIPEDDAKHPTYIQLNSEGEIMSADFTVNDKGGNYTFGNNTMSAPPNSRIIFKDGRINLYSEEGFELKREFIGKSGQTLEKFIKIISGSKEPISIEEDIYGNSIFSGNFKIGENVISGLNNGGGKITISREGRIIKIWEGTDAIVDNVRHQAYGDYLDIYYEEYFNPSEHDNENYFNYARDKFYLGGEGFKSIFSESSPVININPDKERIFEISPRFGADIVIQNRNKYDSSGVLNLEESEAPKITIEGGNSEEIWAEIRDGDINLQVGEQGILDYKISSVRHRDPVKGMPAELNILDAEGRSLLLDYGKKEMKLSLLESGEIRFSTLNAFVDSKGVPHCEFPVSLPTGNVVGKITGRGLGLTTASSRFSDCENHYFTFVDRYSSKAVIESVVREYTENIVDNQHDFEPEYSQYLENIAFYIYNLENKDFLETQIGIIQQLPDYTRIKLFVSDDPDIDYFQDNLPRDVFSRMTFFKAPSEYQFSPWAQDYTEGDSEVQVLPLTYLGGGSRKTPSYPKNEFIYKLENKGIEIRRVPVEFAGGNIFITKNKNGEKLLLIGADDYLSTSETYQNYGMGDISEQEFKEILRNSFNVNSVEIIGERNQNGELSRLNPQIFHIDQVMLPLDDGLVAMPFVSDIIKPDFTNDEINSLMLKEFEKLAKKYGIEYNLFGIDYSKKELSEEKKLEIFSQETAIKKKFFKMEDQIYNYENAVEVKEQLDYFRQQMVSMGFEVLYLRTNPSSIGNYQAYTNSIIYTDKGTGQRTIIMPIFPNENGEYLMEGLNLENKRNFESLGYEVKTVRDKAFNYQGNLHCLSILAQNPQNPPSCPLA